jgi:hypothetical protein
VLHWSFQNPDEETLQPFFQVTAKRAALSRVENLFRGIAQRDAQSIVGSLIDSTLFIALNRVR